MPNLVIDSSLNSVNDKWQSKEVAILVKEKLSYILLNYTDLIEDIKSNVEKCKSTVYGSLKELINHKWNENA